MNPLYMWAGGKTKMLPKYEITPGIPKSGYDTYIEPFFGGGAMMIYLAQQSSSIRRFVLNDINPEIVGLYRAIKTDVAGFMNECDQYCSVYLPLSQADRKKYYYEIRQKYITEYHNWSPVKESATLYFLMKTAFNGIFQSTKEAKGRFCTPSGLLNHKGSVYDRANVLEWHQFLQRVDIYNGNWKNCLEVSDRAFYFFDPPYRDSFTQYGQTFTDQDHSDVIEFCRDADAADHFVFFAGRDTNDDFYTSRQGNLGLAKYPITYTAGRRSTKVDEDGSEKKEAKSATEILLHSKSVGSFSKLFELTS